MKENNLEEAKNNLKAFIEFYNNSRKKKMGFLKFIMMQVDGTDISSIEIVLNELERYKRLAEMNFKDGEEFRKNECEHRCIRKSEVEELKDYYNENYIKKENIEEKIEELRKKHNNLFDSQTLLKELLNKE